MERARLLYDLGKHDEAEKAIREHLAREPNDVHALVLYSEILADSGRWEEGVEQARRVLELEPELVDAHLALAWAYFRGGKPREMLEHARAARRCLPQSPEPVAHIAVAHLMSGRYESALDASLQGLAVDPGNRLCLWARNHALERLEQTEELDAAVDETLTQDPLDGDAHVLKGRRQLARQEYEDALVRFQTALEQDPGNMDAREGLVEALGARSGTYRAVLRAGLALSGDVAGGCALAAVVLLAAFLGSFGDKRSGTLVIAYACGIALLVATSPAMLRWTLLRAARPTRRLLAPHQLYASDLLLALSAVAVADVVDGAAGDAGTVVLYLVPVLRTWASGIRDRLLGLAFVPGLLRLLAVAAPFAVVWRAAAFLALLAYWLPLSFREAPPRLP